MKSKEIAKLYGIEKKDFDNYLLSNGLGTKSASDVIVEDANVEKYVYWYRKAKAQYVEEWNKEQLNKQKALSEMLISSGFNFDGYTITKYSGYISGDDAVQIPRSGYFFRV